MNEYLFDFVTLGTLRVKANSDKEAREKLEALLDCADTNFGAWPDGSPACGEVSLYSPDCEGTAQDHVTLIEINGEAV